ncbi:MAG: type IIL restriction-modification enzyme MmeI [Nannocystaceae bacterium]
MFSHTLNIFTLERCSHLAVMQSRVHEHWARLLGSSLEDRLRYTATDCFETFPFPRNLDSLEAIGERLYTTRAQYMIDTDQGLTKTYNALKDPSITDDPRILELRDLHVEMDRAVLAAYGWSDIEVPPYTDSVTPAEKDARQAFEDEVLDRLFALNAERAAEEARLGTKKGKG